MDGIDAAGGKYPTSLGNVAVVEASEFQALVQDVLKTAVGTAETEVSRLIRNLTRSGNLPIELPPALRGIDLSLWLRPYFERANLTIDRMRVDVLTVLVFALSPPSGVRSDLGEPVWWAV